MKAKHSTSTYRGDIEGLRAIAVGLVVLYHATVPELTGGFIGVDVFFVISGYLITSILLREQHRSNRISLVGFYARRARRILPAATVVILLTVLASYHWLGFIVGNRSAVDAEWAAIFSANVHFALVGTTYLGAQQSPSVLEHMWSLGVEEQFYLFWPALVISLAALARRLSLPRRGSLIVGTGSLALASFIWSVVETHNDATWAYFSPFTRAWELAIGGILAAIQIKPDAIRQFWTSIGAFLGISAIIGSGFFYNSNTPFPSYRALLPVLGAAAVIAAGASSTGTWAAMILSLPPMRWVGRISYSLYLIHWPILTIAAERAGHPLGPLRRFELVLLAIALSAVSYFLIERPIRISSFLQSRTRLCVGSGLMLVAVTILVSQWAISRNFGGWTLFHLAYS